MNLFVSLPSARGVHPLTFWNVFDMRTELEKQGMRLHGSSVYRMPLDLARNELATVFLSTTCDQNLLLDDDVQVDAGWVPKIARAVSAGVDIITVPCRIRDHHHGGAQDWSPFNIFPLGQEAVEQAGLRLLECGHTGLGAVFVSRKVIETLHAEAPKYASRLMPGKDSAAIFTSQVEPATSLVAEAPKDLNVYIMDDMVFSLRARRAGFRIMAAIDTPSCHDGMQGCFSMEAEKLAKAQAKAAEAARGKTLLGPDGKPVRCADWSAKAPTKEEIEEDYALDALERP